MSDRDLPAPPGSIQLRALGTCQVLDGTGRTLIGSGKPTALLVYLALSPRRTASRERLADLLWGDQDRATARSALRRALHFVRSHVAPWVIDATDHACTLAPEVSVDVAAFRRAADAGDFAECLALYRGDLLENFASPGCGEFESWAAIERSHLRAIAARAADSQCRAALERGCFSEARQAAERCREINPDEELGWRLSLEVLLSSGDPIAAAAEAARFEAWAENMSLEPSPSAAASIRAARKLRASSLPSRAGGLTSEMVGREREFSALLQLWESARQGNGAIAFVTGRAGLGKSRLLESVAQRLRALRARTVHVRAYPGEREIPNAFAAHLAWGLSELSGAAGVSQAIVPALLELNPRLSERFAIAAASNGQHPVAHRALAMGELLQAVSEDAPVAILIDDAHWIDEPSLLLLSSLLARVDGSRALFIVTSRSDRGPLSLPDGTVPVALGPLSTGDVAGMVSSLGQLPAEGPLSEALVERLRVASAGVPLFVLEALEHLIERQLLSLEDGRWVVKDLATLRGELATVDPLALRLRGLAEAALTVLVACSAAGVPLDDRLLFAPREAGDHESKETIEALERMGYLTRAGSTVMVAHDLIADVALEVAGEDVRRTSLRNLGRALVGLGDQDSLERGIRFLVRSGHVSGATAPLARVLRARGLQATGLSSSISEIVGLPPGSDVVRQLARSLPLSLRINRAKWGSAAAAILLIGAVLGFPSHPAGRGDPPVLLLGVSAPGGGAVEVPLDSAHWIAGETLETLGLRAAHLSGRVLGRDIRPGTRQWAAEVLSTDSGEVDVALFDSTGMVQRLTDSPADDTPGGWSPDGKQLILLTSRFTNDGHKAMAVMDVASGQLRAIGPTTEIIGPSVWSPDGTRIAFLTGLHSGHFQTLCTIAPDGTGLACANSPSGLLNLVGWISRSGLLVSLEGAPALYVADVDRGTFDASALASPSFADISPDRRWLAYQPGPIGRGPILVTPVTNLTLGRSVRLGLPADPARFRWSGAFEVPEFIDALRPEGWTDTIPLGTSARLAVAGVTSRGGRVPVDRITWRSAAPEVATVDDRGMVRARQTGTAMIEVSLGGWRTLRRTVTVVSNAATLLLEEAWSADWQGRWTGFGVPKPVLVVDTIMGPSFFINGDNRYFSGAYLKHGVPRRHGLALDGAFRAPALSRLDQYVQLVIAGRTTNQVVPAWDHATGYMPQGFLDDACGIVYPRDEGPDGFGAMRPVGKLRRGPRSQVPDVRLGDPIPFRIQVFPDGRCGIWVKGQGAFMSDINLAGADSLYVVIQGKSVASRIVVGTLTLRAGVVGGVSWEQALPGR